MNDLFDELVMDDEKKDQMRDTLRHTKAARKTPLIVMAGVAAAIALVMVIPFTRTAVVSAAEKLITQFTTHIGTKVTVNENDEDNKVNVKIKTDRKIVTHIMYDGENGHFIGINVKDKSSKDYAQLIDGKIYFVLDGNKTDVTDQISNKDYYRHEIKNADGSREVVFIGGTPENFGWWSVYYNADRKYVFNEGSIPNNDYPEWFKNACRSENIFWGGNVGVDMPDSYSVSVPAK
ncbi:MAG: hypothetical protein J5657_02875 [Clostridiales bacterium]|nr:hypothetical protein [Clostridiales bacterium]